MAERGLRAHIYLTERTLVEFATRRKRTDRPLERNVGPEPVRRVLAELLRPETEPQIWLRQTARRRGGTESSAGADAVEQPGPRGDRGHGQPGSVRSAGARTGLPSRDHRLPDAGGGDGRGRSRVDVRGRDRQAAQAEDGPLKRPFWTRFPQLRSSSWNPVRLDEAVDGAPERQVDLHAAARAPGGDLGRHPRDGEARRLRVGRSRPRKGHEEGASRETPLPGKKPRAGSTLLTDDRDVVTCGKA